MNEHTIVNGIFAAIVIVVFLVRIARKFGVGAAPAPQQRPTRQSAAQPAATKLDTAQVRGSLMRRIAATVNALPQAAQAARAAPESAAPTGPARPAAPPFIREAPRRQAAPLPPAQAFAAAAAAAFPVLDLTLPEADRVDALAPVRRRRRAPRGGLIGSPGWSASAIVALEVLGPPVSLRSGATLGAPHAF